MRFFAEPDDGGGGGEALDILDAPETDIVKSAESGAPEPDTVVPPPAFDPKVFAQEFGKTFAETHAAATAKPEAKPLTPEEAKKLLNVWEPNDAWYAKYDNLETRKAAIAEQRDALIRQADTVAQIRMQQMREELMKEFTPLRESFQRQEVQARQERFGVAWPALAKVEMAPIVSAVTQGLVQEGKTFANEKAAFDEVAKRVEVVMQQSNPAFKLSVGAVPLQKPKPNGGIPVTTPGAGGGGGGGGNASAPKGANRALAILGDVGS